MRLEAWRQSTPGPKPSAASDRAPDLPVFAAASLLLARCGIDRLLEGSGVEHGRRPPHVPLAQGFMYLAAIIDWFSRCVIAWRLSWNTLTGRSAWRCWRKALSRGRLEVPNTDQGVQFTAHSLDRAAGVGGGGGEYGWRRSACRQCLRERPPVADGQVRGHLPVGLRGVPQLRQGLGATFRTTTKNGCASGALDYRTPAAVYQQRGVGG